MSLSPKALGCSCPMFKTPMRFPFTLRGTAICDRVPSRFPSASGRSETSGIQHRLAALSGLSRRTLAERGSGHRFRRRSG